MVKNIQYICYGLVIVWGLTNWWACSEPVISDQKRFQRFVRSFQEINLPIDTALLYRVHSSDLVTARIDTALVQDFIDKDYKLRVGDPVFDGYGYGVRLPREDTASYEALIYYYSEGREQFFVLHTYALDGTSLGSLPISGDSSSYKRLTATITERRVISVHDYILHHPEKGLTEYLYEIRPDGEIVLLDVFYK